MEKSVPIGAALLIIAIILGWIGCDGSAKLAEQAKKTLDVAGDIAESPSSPPRRDTSNPLPTSSTPTADTPPRTAGYPSTTQPRDPSRNSDFSNRTLPQTAQGNETIVIGTFNIQTFGRSKIKHPGVVRVLESLVRQFDVLAIQELRSIDQTLIDDFVSMVNADPALQLRLDQGTATRQSLLELHGTVRLSLRSEYDRAG